MVENARVKIRTMRLWSYHHIQIASNHLDPTVFWKEALEKILLIEISCPADINVLDKEIENPSTSG